MDSKHVKEMAKQMGADLCGIAPANRFTGAPEGFHPRDVLPGCQSVIMLACRFNPATLHARSTSPYTIVRNDLSNTMNHLAVSMADTLYACGCDAVPIGSIGPDEYDEKAGRYRGTISLKHAAELAGLGRIGRNTLLVNDRFGNMIWLSAVLATSELEPDPVADYEPCIPGCSLCVKNCPVHALDGETIDQMACFQHAFGAKNGGEWKIHCFACRKVCPNHLGLSHQSNK